MSTMDILHSETVLTASVTLLGAVWTLFKGSAWLRAHKRRRLLEALKALEAAVEATYGEYVRALKESNPDGRLKPEEQRLARQYAREKAVMFARRRGINLLRELGPDYVDLWTSRMVRKLKQTRQARR